jgi:hypothetical protein
MDHDWDGFYTSMKRLSRFVAQVQTGKTYTVTYTGTPPKNMRYTLRSDSGTKGVVVKVPYPNAGAYSVSINSVIIQPLGWDSATRKPKLIDTATAVCGTNRFVGVENYLEFYLTPGCIAVIAARDAILSSVRLQWTAVEFFEGDGVTTFCQRMASVLGIDASRIKVVSVYEGSLNVNFQILSDPATVTANSDGAVVASQAAITDLKAINEKLLTSLAVGSTAFGGALLEV